MLVADADEVAAVLDQPDELLARLVGAPLVVDVDVDPDPADDGVAGVALRQRAHQLPAVAAVERPHAELRVVRFAAFDRGLPDRADGVALVGMHRGEPGVAQPGRVGQPARRRRPSADVIQQPVRRRGPGDPG